MIILDVSRITLGRTTFHKQRVDVGRAVRHAAEVAGPLIERRGHELVLTMPSAAAYTDANPVRLEQVFVKLLNIAAKYPGDGGRISVEVIQDGDHVTVRVADTGMGIGPELLPHIFDLSVQGDPTINRPGGGLGSA